tara:strand:+ start:11081 stop:11554 length:474 start_codon:yes stop_codon:yes gene_type:complete
MKTENKTFNWRKSNKTMLVKLTKQDGKLKATTADGVNIPFNKPNKNYPTLWKPRAEKVFNAGQAYYLYKYHHEWERISMETYNKWFNLKYESDDSGSCVVYKENDKGWETWGSDKHGTPFTSKNEAIKEARKLGIKNADGSGIWDYNTDDKVRYFNS